MHRLHDGSVTRVVYGFPIQYGMYLRGAYVNGGTYFVLDLLFKGIQIEDETRL